MKRRAYRCLCFFAALLFAFPALSAADAPLGVTRALLVGMDGFVTMQRLSPAAENNVENLRKVLSEGMDPPQIHTAFGPEAATAAALSARLEEAFSGSAETDTLLLYLCTHGMTRGTGSSRLLLSDGEWETTLTPATLAELLAPYRGNKLVIIDACCSGGFAEGPLPETGVTVLTASGPAESSWYWTDAAGSAQGSFYFTQQLCFGLSEACGTPADRDADGAVTMEELYRYLLESHGASTPQLSAGARDTVLLRPGPSSAQESALRDIVFSADAVPAGEGAVLTAEFTVSRPVCVAYQLVPWDGAKWDFPSAQILYDGAERYSALGSLAGAVTAGRKRREIDLSGLGQGYVLIQLISLDEGRITVHAGHCVAILGTDATFSAACSARDGAVFLNCYDLAPCRLTVTLTDPEGNTVRRLAVRQATRPSPDGVTRLLLPCPEDLTDLRLLIKAEFSGSSLSVLTAVLP